MKTRIILLFAIMALTASCKTYTVPVDSFRTQMTATSAEGPREVQINHPVVFSASNSKQNLSYQANRVKFIQVFDKKGNQVRLENSPKLEIRITKKDGKKHILFFDTVVVENDTVKGARSRIMQRLRREIALADIEKIEIQDSGKVYKYQK